LVAALIASASAVEVEVDVEAVDEGLNEAEQEIEHFIAEEAATENEHESEVEGEAEAVAEVEAEAEAEAETEVEAESEVEVGAGASNCFSTAGLAMVKSFEGFYPKMYKDVAGIPTIGYGTLCSDKLIDCSKRVTEPVAAAILAADLLKHYGPCVASAVKAPLNNNQYSALVSFAYNAGCGALQSVAKATGLGRAVGANYAGVGARMKLYNKAHVHGVLQPVAGLTRRRAAEANLFNSKAAATCIAGSTASPVLKSAAPSPSVMAGRTTRRAAAKAARKAAKAARKAAKAARKAFRALKKAKKAKKPAPYGARELFNLKRGSVDLPSGTVLAPGPFPPNSTPHKRVAKADIAPTLVGRRRNRGPVGKWSQKAQRAAAKAKVTVENA